MLIRPLLLSTLLIMLTTASLSVSAQNTMFLRQSPIAHLDEQDRKILRETIKQVLEATDGTLIEWSNPDSGSNGRVKVLDTTEQNGMPCRSVRARNQSNGRQADGIYKLCKDNTGTWRFASAGNNPANSNPAAKTDTQ